MTKQSTNQPFLATLNMTVDNDQHSKFNTADETSPLLTENFISPLTHYGLLAIDGPDSKKFLQGQATCDTTTVNEQQSSGGAFCTVKGRMISSFHIASLNDHQMLLRMRRELAAETITRLSKYIVFSKAEQRNASEEYCLIGLHGPQAKSNISQAFGSLPAAKNGSVQQQGNIAIQLDDQQLSFECWIAWANIEQLWPLLSQQLTLTGSKSWELLCIQNGWGEVSAKTVELFIPQMLNYQITGAVNFTKGCYTGQEIVARMQYKGKLKRPMYRISIDASGFAAGDELFNSESGQSVGHIVNVVTLNDQSSEALAVISHKDLASNCVTAGKQQATITRLPLPYAITMNDN